MSRKPKHKGSKLTADDRITIQGCLRIMEEQRKRKVPENERMTVAKMAEMLGRHRSTVYREIARNSYEKDEPTIPCPLLGRKCLICNLCPKHSQSAADEEDGKERKHRGQAGKAEEMPEAQEEVRKEADTTVKRHAP